MEVRRATFEQVKDAQAKLKFDYLEYLIEKNETIDNDSRRAFFDNIAIALLGFEKNYEFYLEYGNKVCNLGNLAVWIRKFMDFKDTPDKKQEIAIRGEKVKINNKDLWNNLMLALYEPMADALQLSTKISAETLMRESKAFEFKSGSKIKE